MQWCNTDVAERWVAYTKNPTGLRGGMEEMALATDVYERFQDKMDKRYQGRVHFSANPAYIFGPNGKKVEAALQQSLRCLLEGSLSAEVVYKGYFDNQGVFRGDSLVGETK